MKKIILFVLSLTFLMAIPFLTFAEIVNPSLPYPTNVSLASDGTVNFDIPSNVNNGAELTFKSFQMRLVKATSVLVGTEIVYKHSATGSIKTVNVDDRDYSFNIGSAGYYYVAVRGLDLSGAYTLWAIPGSSDGFADACDSSKGGPASGVPSYTTVSSDDTNQGGGGSQGGGSVNGGPGVNGGMSNNNGGSNVIGPGYNYNNNSNNNNNYNNNGRGFINDSNGTYYVKQDGSYIKDTWAEINGSYYKFNKDGYIKKNAWHFEQANMCWYYLDESGRMVTGPLVWQGKWYYLNPVKGANYGVMACNTEIQVNGAYYAYGQDGAMIINGYFNNHYYGPIGMRIQ